MKQNIIEVIIAFFIILILIIMMTLVGITIIRTSSNIEQIIRNERVDYEKLYPFETVSKQNAKHENTIERYKTIIEKVKSKLEDYTSEELIGYEKLVEYSYVYNDVMQYKLVSNSNELDRIDLENGYLSTVRGKRNVKECADRIINFKEFLKENNINLLYVQAPYKISEYQVMPSNIYKDYTNENMNDFLSYIDKKVDYIDLRENIKQNKFDYLSLFYKTDHHWLPETGLWVAGEISKYLNTAYNFNLDIDNINPNKYNIKVYPKMFLGSDGRYVSLKNSEPEDFNLITPKFTTKLDVKILDKKIDKSDTFEETLIDWSLIKYDNYYLSNQYAAYAYGDKALIEIHNELVNNNKKILIVKDSFANVVSPFLALENENVSIIDLRYYNGSLKKYISEFKPDLVIVMYTGTVLKDLDIEEKNFWNFE